MQRARRRALLAGTISVVAGCTVFHPLGRYQEGADEADAASGDPDAQTTGPDVVVVGDAGPSWTLYSYDTVAQAWSAPARLEDKWSGPNAPPPRGIASVVQLVDDDRLLVFTDDGSYYVRAACQWRAPVQVAQAWAPMAKVPKGASHVPFAFINTVVADASNNESVVFEDNPVYFLFDYFPDDTIVFRETGTLSDRDGGPKQRAGTVAWTFEVLDLSNPDAIQRYVSYSLYDDGRVHALRADGTFVSWAIAESPFWQGKAGAAPTTGLTAAYFDEAARTARFIGP